MNMKLPKKVKKVVGCLYLDEKGELWIFHRSTFPLLTFKGNAKE